MTNGNYYKKATTSSLHYEGKKSSARMHGRTIRTNLTRDPKGNWQKKEKEMTKVLISMSVLEIILLILMGAGVITYCTIIILKALKKKKKPQKEEEEEITINDKNRK